MVINICQDLKCNPELTFKRTVLHKPVSELYSNGSKIYFVKKYRDYLMVSERVNFYS